MSLFWQNDPKVLFMATYVAMTIDLLPVKNTGNLLTAYRTDRRQFPSKLSGILLKFHHTRMTFHKGRIQFILGFL